MQPLINIKKGKLNLATLFLDEKRPYITMGSSPLCDFTTFEQSSIESLRVCSFSQKQLKLCIPKDSTLQLTIDKQELLVDKLKALGLVKERPDHLEINLKPNSLTFGGFSCGEFALQFRFEEKPAPPEKIALPASNYWRGYIQQFDWQYVTIFCCMALGTLAFGNYLYGLPAPIPQREAIVNEVTFHFAKIVVPKEALTVPAMAPAASGNAGTTAGGGGSPAGDRGSRNNNNLPLGGRELLNQRVDNLLSRIDSRMLDTNAKGGGNGKSTGNGSGSGDFGLLDKLTKGLDAGTGSGGGSGIAGRTLYNYQPARPIDTSKTLANIDTTRSSTNSTPRDIIDTGNANMVLRLAYGKIRGCYEDALRFDRGLTGKVNMRFNIDSAGRASSIRLEPSEKLQNDGFLACLQQVIGSLEFTPAHGTAPVQFSMIFTPNTTAAK